MKVLCEFFGGQEDGKQLWFEPSQYILFVKKKPEENYIFSKFGQSQSMKSITYELSSVKEGIYRYAIKE